MTNSRNVSLLGDKNPFLALLMVFAFVCVGFLLAAIATGVLAALGLEINTSDFENSGSKDWWSLMIVQGITSLSIFLVGTLLFIYIHLKKTPAELFKNKFELPKAALFTIIATFSFMIVNSIFIEWNQGIQLPESLSDFEEMARANEDKLAELTAFLTTFDSFPQLIMALLVIAGFAAVGEEFLFRGVLQPIFQSLFKNHHVAIWFTALFFGVIHMQFYGIVPRMLLGVLFGYLFYYSGNLIYAIIAHFINNGLSILMVYLYNNSAIEYDIENTESVPWYVLLVFTIIFCFALYSFLKLFQEQPNDEQLAESI